MSQLLGRKTGKYRFMFSSIPYPQTRHVRSTPTLHARYTPSTRKELGKITYSKIAHTLYVFLYFVTLLVSLLYKNRALEFPEVVVYTMRIKTVVDLRGDRGFIPFYAHYQQISFFTFSRLDFAS